jgi:phage terminase large subunit
VALPFKLDWKNPDYTEVYEYRAHLLNVLDEDKTGETLRKLKLYYAENPVQFIIDWGVTFDQRNALKRDKNGKRYKTKTPFIPFEKQEELLYWLLDRMNNSDDGLIEKSRDEGVSWITIALGATMCMFMPGVKIGYGSRKEEYVDKIGDPKSLFWKAREFVDNVPVEFRAGWVRGRHDPFMRMIFPDTGSAMTGESGNNIGRGDRCSVYFVDEAAHLEQPESVDMSLSSTTDCRIDLSSVNGRANPFAIKRFSGKIPVFTFHWKDDPRKDQAWRDKLEDKYDPIVIAQEHDIDYMASVENVILPSVWVMAAIDAHGRLGLTPSGDKFGALDVGDQGDKCTFCAAHGWLIEDVEEWAGKGSDLFYSAQKAVNLCDEYKYKSFRYDGDGLGASVKGDVRVINETRDVDHKIQVVEFRGSAAVVDPTKTFENTDRTNLDYFANLKAQAWFDLRTRFRNTYRWVVENKPPLDKSKIISIAPNCKNRDRLVIELSQPTYTMNGAGKMLIDKVPDGAKSPNLADSVMMRMAKLKLTQIKISGSVMSKMMATRMGRR